MGSCSSQMMQKLSPQFGKYMAAQKGKQTIDKRIGEFKSNVSQEINNCKQELQEKVNY